MSGDDPDVLDRLILAEQDERRRLALFLHDGPVQALSGIALMLDGALHAIAGGANEQAREIVQTALGQQRATVRELRDLSFVLEPVVLRDRGLEPALRALADQTEHSHALRVAVDVDDTGLLGDTASIAVYTILRELVEQAVRRGPPTEIEIRVARNGNGSIVASVSDNAEPERRRRTIEAIEERAKQLHGSVEVLSHGRGSEIRVTLPAHTVRR